jgi:hypothetical protein
VALARAAFNAAKDKKMLIYKTDRHGNKTEKMTTFDETAEKIIATRSTWGDRRGHRGRRDRLPPTVQPQRHRLGAQ